MEKMNNNKDVNKLYESYVEDLRSYLNWALSNLNKYKNELIDIGFVIYLELYAKLFKLSKSHGKNYLLEFKNVFDKKFDNYIQKLLQYKFLDQLDELFLINIGYNKSNKYIIVITKNSKRVLLNWLSIYYNNIINVILLEKVEFIDSEMFNHNSFNLFKRYFILKYNINPDNINKYYNQPFLGLIVKDTNYLLGDGDYVYSDQNKKEEITYGLPYELLFTTGREFVTNEYTYSITNELCKLEEYNKLIPLPRIGTLLNDSLRSLYYIQNCNRIVPSNFNKNKVSRVTSVNNTADAANSSADGDNGNSGILSNVTFSDQNDTQSDTQNVNTGNVEDENKIESDVIYILSYGISNNNQMNCCTLSSFDGKFIVIGQNNGIILLYDLLTTECNNVYNDISCIIGSGIAYKSVSSLNPSFTKSHSNLAANYNYDSDEQGEYNYSARDEDEENSNIIYGHDGVVNCVKFGENGQVLLSAGNDGLIKLYTTNNNSCKAIYYNSATTNTTNNNINSMNSMTNVSSVLKLDYGNFGYYFSSCDVNGYCKLWCTDRSFPLRTYKPVNNSFYFNRFHPNSSLITLLSYNDIFTIYDLKSNKLALQFCYNTVNFDEFRTILYQSNGNSKGNKNSKNNSNTMSNNNDKSMNNSMNSVKSGIKNVDGRGRINWSKNGMIYGISKENVILLYDVRNGKLLEKIVHNSRILDFDFSYSTNVISVIDQNNMSFWAFNSISVACRQFLPQSILTTIVIYSNMNKYILNYQVNEEEDLEPVKLKKNLLKAYKFNDMNLVHNAYTPENVLLSLGVSTL